MSQKRRRGNESGVVAKRKWLTLEKKLEIIKRHENGASYARIALENGMNEASVRTIIRKKDQYKEQGMSTAFFVPRTITKQRSTLLINMERLLLIWIEDCNRKRIPLSQNIIQAKAVNLYNALREKRGNVKGETKEVFTASRGWFFRFKNRVGLRNVRISAGNATSIDKGDAVRLTNERDDNVNETPNYEENGIFNDAGLAWKKMPLRTFLAENEKERTDSEPTKDPLKFLLARDTSEDYKVKPLLVFRAQNSRTPKNHVKDDLPVIDITKIKKDLKLENLSSDTIPDCIETGQNNSEDATTLETDQRILCKEEEESLEADDVEMKEFSTEELEKVLHGVDMACDAIINGDPDSERGNRIRQILQDGIQCYKDLYTERMERRLPQTTLLTYLNKR